MATQAIAAPEAPTQAAAAAEAPRELHGFKLVRDEYVHEYDSHVRTYCHEKTGEGGFRQTCTLPLCRVVLYMRDVHMTTIKICSTAQTTLQIP